MEEKKRPAMVLVMLGERKVIFCPMVKDSDEEFARLQAGVFNALTELYHAE